MPDLRHMAVILTRHPCAVSAPGISANSGGRETRGIGGLLLERIRSAKEALRSFDSWLIQEAANTMGQMLVQKRHYGRISSEFAANTLYKTLN